MKRGIRSGVLSALLLVVAVACGQTSSSGAGSNTNWLRRCATDSQCGESLSCWCGVCTAPCTNDDACTSLDSGARCLSGNTCSSAPAPGDACGVSCKDNGDCAPGSFCSDGMCKVNAATDGDRCVAERSARATFIAENRACASDLDCRIASSNCTDGGLPCTQAFYLNVNADIAEFERLSNVLLACATDPARGPDTCHEPACHRVTPAAHCGVDGQCTGITEEPSCDGRILGLTKSMGEVVKAADKTCQVDGDCRTVGLASSCFSTCNTVAVSSGSAAAVQSAFDALVGNVCPAYQQAGCPTPLNLACLPSNATCQNGTCRDVTELDCNTARSELSTLMLAAEAAAPRDCTSDADCTTIARANSCYDACSSDPISVSAASALRENFDAIGREHCPRVLAASCSFPIPPCAPPAAVSCQSGKCAFAEP